MHNNITLTSLGILVDVISEIDKLCMHLCEVGTLKTLHLYGVEERKSPSLVGLSKLHHVTELKLFGKLRMLPPKFPPNLSQLSLRSIDLMDDPMPILEKLVLGIIQEKMAKSYKVNNAKKLHMVTRDHSSLDFICP